MERVGVAYVLKETGLESKNCYITVVGLQDVSKRLGSLAPNAFGGQASSINTLSKGKTVSPPSATQQNGANRTSQSSELPRTNYKESELSTKLHLKHPTETKIEHGKTNTNRKKMIKPNMST